MKALVALRVVCTALLACLPVLSASAQTKVVAGIPSAILPYMSGVVYAKEMGFYKEEGLDVEFISVQGSGVLIPQVVNKAVTFGLVVGDLPVVALAKGEPYPITFFYNVYPSYFFEVAVLDKSPIKSMADLKGKKLGVGALSWGNIPITRAMLAQSGVTWMKDVEVLPVGIGPAAWKRLADGEIDAINLFAHEHERMMLSGVPIRRLPTPEGYDKMFSNAWMAHNDTLKNNPELAVAFARAYAKGYYACTVDPEKCLRAFWKFDPASRPPADKEAEWIAGNLAVLKVDLAKATSGLKDRKFEPFDDESWAQLVAALKAGEVIGTDKVDTQKLYTNDLVAKINDFDLKAVEAKVKQAP